jgi:hypothetical protein
MSEGHHLADTLIAFFAYADHGVLTPFTAAVSGLTAEQATRIPIPGLHSIWALVSHVRFWHEATLLQLRGLPVDLGDPGARDGWPPPGDPSDDEAWQVEVSRTTTLNQQIAEMVERLTDKELAEPVVAGRITQRQVIQALIAHNCYHTCSIISVRRMLGLWPAAAR